MREVFRSARTLRCGARIPPSCPPRPRTDTGRCPFGELRADERESVEPDRPDRQLECLLESLTVGVLMVTRADRRVLFVNRRFAELTGTSFAPGDHFAEGIVPMQREDGRPIGRGEGTLPQVLRTGRPATNVDIVFLRADGQRIPVLVTSTPVSLSGGAEFDAAVAMVHDRREVERAVAELRASERRFEAATQATGQAIYEWDLVEDTCRFSGALEAVFGLEPGDVNSNAKWNQHTHPADLPAVQREMQSSIRERRLFDCVYRLRHRDGRWMWVRDRGTIQFDADGRPLRMIGAIADVTAQHELEERLRQAQKMETVGTLAGGIAHDFNNQLTVVLGHLSLLEEGLAERPERRASIEMARGAAERCAELTRSLLAFSRRLPTQPRPAALNAIVSDTAGLVSRVVPPTIQVRLELADDLPPVMVDPAQLQQVLFNLFVNARDAMPEGGTLTVRTARTEIGAGEAAGDLAPGPYAEIAVLDTGEGIQPEDLRRIFEPFFTTKPVGAGPGLGLSMIYGIVSQHGGRVDVSSEPGRGSAFHVLLPLEAPAASPAAAPVAGRLEGVTVLVVDDEPLVRAFAWRALEAHGCRVFTAGDGDEALARLRAAPDSIGVVILDLTMPGRCARETLEAMRQVAPGIAVIVTSGFSQTATESEGLGALPFLPKPFSPAALIEAIRAASRGTATRSG